MGEGTGAAHPAGREGKGGREGKEAGEEVEVPVDPLTYSVE